MTTNNEIIQKFEKEFTDEGERLFNKNPELGKLFNIVSNPMNEIISFFDKAPVGERHDKTKKFVAKSVFMYMAMRIFKTPDEALIFLNDVREMIINIDKKMND